MKCTRQKCSAPALVTVDLVYPLSEATFTFAACSPHALELEGWALGFLDEHPECDIRIKWYSLSS